MSDYWRGLVEHLLIATTNNYSAVADNTLYFITARIKSSDAVT